MDVDIFTKQMHFMHRRLDELYRDASTPLGLDLLSVAFKELGVASEELQVVLEELKQQNQELTDRQIMLEIERQRYQELFEFVPDGYIVTDAAGVIQEANCAAAKMLKVSQHFLVGKPLMVFVDEDERQSFHCQLLCPQQSEHLQEWIVNISPRKGETFNASLKVSKVSDKKGNIIGMRVYIRADADGKEVQALKVEDHDLSQQEEKHVDLPKHIYLKGESIPIKPQCIWQVCQGVVKLSTVRENGEEVLVGLAGPSMPFGSDLTVLQTYQAVALSTVELVCFSLDDVLASPALIQSVFTQINQRLHQTEALLAISGQRHVKDRLHHLLLLLKQEIGQPVPEGTRLSVRFTHQEIADACSTTRVTITRLLGKLQQEGKIILDSKNHIILKQDAGSDTFGLKKAKVKNNSQAVFLGFDL